ncbi:hypothetical protein QUA40_13375 [Microcoleus sp. Pol11C3]|uniref:hypothetical protein n=1 Tax=Microcoleus sp. Pol11C3 TaxID=3055390 RepID=UPI002FD471A6
MPPISDSEDTINAGIFAGFFSAASKNPQAMFVCTPSSQRKDLLTPPVQLCDSVMQVCFSYSFYGQNNQQERDVGSTIPASAGVSTKASARMGKKAENLCEFLFTVNISSGRKRVSSLADSLVTMTNRHLP